MNTPSTDVPLTDSLWSLSLNDSIALGAMVVFWLGFICGSFMVLWSK